MNNRLAMVLCGLVGASVGFLLRPPTETTSDRATEAHCPEPVTVPAPESLRASPPAPGMQRDTELAAANAEIARLRAELALPRPPQDPVVAFRERVIAEIERPRSLDRTPEEEAIRLQNSTGMINDHLEQLDNANFQRLLRRSMEWRFDYAETQMGLVMPPAWREEVVRIEQEAWTKFREWKRSEWLPLVKEAKSNADVERLTGMYTSRRWRLTSDIITEVRTLTGGDDGKVWPILRLFL